MGVYTCVFVCKYVWRQNVKIWPSLTNRIIFNGNSKDKVKLSLCSN